MRCYLAAVSLILSVVLAVCLSYAKDPVELDHDPSTKEMVQDRDLALYDDGGDFAENHMQAADWIAMRTFIWEHWTQKKRGYIRFKSLGVDTSVQSHMFIEPRDEHTWHIQARDIVHWSGGDLHRRTLSENEVVAVDREKPGNADYSGREALLLHTTDGEVITL
jgi:hypothetical protein